MTRDESADWVAMTKGEVFVLNRDDEWGHLILDFDDLPGSSTENDEYSVDYG